MRAIWLREFGPPSALTPGEAPEPVGEAVIEVRFSNITFVETQMRAGRGPFPVQLPMIPGNGVGGVVGARRVIASLGGSGGYAERVAVPAAALIEVPEAMALDDAVALLADGRTATMLADAAAVGAGERVLVLAAAGGVGTLLTQLALRAGASVVGAVGAPAKRTVVEALGGSGVLYDEVAGPFDVVFDGVGGEVARAAFACLARGGRMLSYGLASGSWAKIAPEEAAARGVTLVSPDRDPAKLRGYTERALASGLRPLIGQRFPLENAADAHAAIEARTTTGKTLLEVR
ncbi:zinc-binding dehydrogenase [Solirubrobacter soli]|uniref:zinc-binding dehydrogenase n=1 Tax=Solirubrobacter soli TaxID=363832 RepID=UPI00048A0F81